MSARGDWTRVKALFAQALDLPEAERERWAADQCGDDADTLAELRSLLAAQSAPRDDLLSRGERLFGNFFETPVDNARGPGAGARIGPYRLLREIGAGGMGRVFLAERADGQFTQPHVRISRVSVEPIGWGPLQVEHASRRLWRSAPSA